jgi:glycosyltransferase involved in cell wall biosynthesis
MSTVRFSIAMATYNGERFLQAQLDSLARQTMLPHELVVCDDGSTDATLDVLTGFARTAPFKVNLIQNEQNIGFGDTFLRAASLCNGNWIAFSDQDDVWFRTKLQRCADVIAQYPEAVLLSHSAEQVDQDLRPLAHRLPNHRTLTISRRLSGTGRSRMPGFSCVFLRKLLEPLPLHERPDNPFQPGEKQVHDQLIVHLADAYGDTIRLPESLALYRRHGHAVTGEAGSRVHKEGFFRRFRSGLYAREEGYRQMISQALQHHLFYQTILMNALASERDTEFISRTKDAVDYYDRLSKVYIARAQVYAGSASIAGRLAAYVRCCRDGVYANGSPLGRTRLFAMAKDFMRSVIP